MLLKGQSSANLSISQEMHPLLSATSCHYLHLLVIMRLTSLSLAVILPLSLSTTLSMSATSCHLRHLLVIMRTSLFACNFIFVFVGNIAFVFVDNFVFVFVGNFLPLLSSARHHKDWDEAHLILDKTITTAGYAKKI